MPTISNLHGRINDVDAHMAIPAKLWASEFGDASARASAIFMDGLIGSAGVSEAIDIDRDETAINAESIAQVRGSAAPGAIDTARRIDVLDFMGVSRSLIFPTGLGLIGMFFASGTATSVREHFPKLDYDAMDVPALGLAIIDEYNAWALRKNAEGSGRLRFVGLVPTDSLSEMEAHAQRLVDGGIGALLIASSNPPGGHSPADPALDVFWRYCAESNVPVVFHVGGEGGFMKTRAWRENVENFKYRPDNLELTVEPYTLATNYFAPANFLTTMVLGGVFERHPGLRVGVMELAGNWVGPLADNLDFWSEHPSQFKRIFAASLSLRPSEYLRRNVRVSPFYFEPVDDYLGRHPHMAEVFCFATDYPHREGGSSPMDDQWERVAPLGQPIVEKFFCENAKWLLP